LVAGKVAGQIPARERVELQAKCLVQGDIKYGSIAVEHGARVMGLLLQVDESGEESPSGLAPKAARSRASMSISKMLRKPQKQSEQTRSLSPAMSAVGKALSRSSQM
jgi:cytoskeletal protein CcmA (bactofilin family)